MFSTATFETFPVLTPATTPGPLAALAGNGLAGGAAYDALVAATALDHELTGSRRCRSRRSWAPSSGIGRAGPRDPALRRTGSLGPAVGAGEMPRTWWGHLTVTRVAGGGYLPAGWPRR